MDIIKESPLCFTDGEELKKEGAIYWDPSSNLYAYWENSCAWQYIPEAIALEIAKIDSLADAAARLQEDLGLVKGRLVKAQKRRDVAEKAVKTLQADLHGSMEREEALKGDLDRVRTAHQDMGELLNGTKKELRATTEALGCAQRTVRARGRDLAQALDSIGALEREAKVVAELVEELEDSLAEKAPALEPSDLVDLRGTCTVDEVLRMRAAGVL